jgi:hypothetical protein
MGLRSRKRDSDSTILTIMKLDEREQRQYPQETINAVSDALARERSIPSWVNDEWLATPVMWFTELEDHRQKLSKCSMPAEEMQRAASLLEKVKRENVLMHVGAGNNPNPYRASHIVKRALASELRSIIDAAQR